MPDSYVEALCREIRSRGDCHQVSTVYFGGGTPSLLSIGQLSAILAALADSFDLSAVEEATLEANPEHLTPEFLAELSGLRFFNRLSIGVQSFSDHELRAINRSHTAAQAIRAVNDSYSAGFHNISVDLIYGLPGQTGGHWLANLQQLAALPVSHLSCYSLSVEPGTMLQKQVESGKIALPDEETVLKDYETLLRWAPEHGFLQYEISNFAQNGRRSRHNSRYWDRSPYFGFGASAHSFDGSSRRWNVADNESYIKNVLSNITYCEQEILTPADAYNELVMTSLRTTAGIAKAQIPQSFHGHLRQSVAKYIEEGLIVETATHYVPTAKGLLHADGIAADLFV